MINKYLRIALLTNGAFAVLFNSTLAYAQTNDQTNALPMVAPAPALQAPPPPPTSASETPANTPLAQDVMIIPSSSQTQISPFDNTVAPAAPMVVVPISVPVSVPISLELPVGTIIEMTPVGIVSTKKLKVGDTVELTVLNDVAQGGKVYVPRGTKGFAIVDEAVGSRVFGKGGQMTMTFQKIELPAGVIVELSGQHAETGARANTGLAQQVAQSGAAIAGSFGAVGALAGIFAAAALKGSAAKIKPGAILKARTSNILTIGTDGLVSLVKAAKASGDLAPAAISLPGSLLSSLPANPVPAVSTPSASAPAPTSDPVPAATPAAPVAAPATTSK